MTDASPRFSVVLPAAGKGTRLGSETPKAFVPLDGEPLFAHAIRPFLPLDGLAELMIVRPPGPGFDEDVVGPLPADTPVRVTEGGSSRFASVRNGARALSVESDLLLVHDAARPFVDRALIERVLAATQQHGAAIATRPIPDTIKRVRDGVIRETVDRAGLYRAQTPQGFRREWFLDALEKISTDRTAERTDDASVVSEVGYPVHTVDGSWYNLKITHPGDLDRAERLLAAGLVPRTSD